MHMSMLAFHKHGAQLFCHAIIIVDAHMPAQHGIDTPVKRIRVYRLIFQFFPTADVEQNGRFKWDFYALLFLRKYHKLPYHIGIAK